MTLSNKKIIVFVAIIATSVILILIFTLLGALFIPSVQNLIQKYGEAKKADTELSAAQDTYYSTVQKLEGAEEEYNKQKNKYNSISDETIDIIKEATTEESYNIEYMWITLGNYAKKNNLEIVLVEPGGTATTNTSKDANSSSSNSNNATTTTTTTTTTNTNNTTANNTATTSNTTTNNTATNNTTTNNSTNSNATTTNNNQTSTDGTNSTSDNTTSSSGSALKVQLTGSYMNISDFIFEIENDTSLRFKLDNISMDYVEGTTIKTTFDVKNVVVNK